MPMVKSLSDTVLHIINNYFLLLKNIHLIYDFVNFLLMMSIIYFDID